MSLPLQKEKVLAVGLMSGTSGDGVDAALVEIENSSYDTKVTLLAFETLAYEHSLKQRIFAACDIETARVDEICRLNVELAEKMAEAVLLVLKNTTVQLSDLDFVSSHGQTLHHLPEEFATMQIGELAVIAERTNTLTVGDFRPTDLAVGGQGAPLVPFVDDLLFRSTIKGRCLINIGGMANLTVLPKSLESAVIAFDTGPGNVLIDEVIRIGSNGTSHFDEGGQLASTGRVDNEWLKEILASDRFLHKSYPKSTGREYYHRELARTFWAEGIKRGLSFSDIVATVTNYTVEAIAITVKEQLDPHIQLDEFYVGGGGVHNLYMMKQLSKRLNRPVKNMEALAFSSDAKEAIAFAVLGNEFLKQQPNNTPSATGAKKKVSMGKIAFPSFKN
ncbi:anhydro-N-acetylmuramic acid kinase [Alkalihalobacillus pseudalcaliphilus]|nr:anhydro-N-acetylmuramic acid kinase [Alkalihalobacillus pseudalcaliphilus]